jgi:hypothetical protein
MSTFPYQSPAQPGVIHTHDCCPKGAAIPLAEREPGVVGGSLCPVCVVLDDLLTPPPDPAGLRDKVR